MLLLGLAACGGQDFEPPDRTVQVAEADALLGPAAFDTVLWASDEVRASEGNLVYAAKCRVCHGSLGAAGSEYARERGLDVPSLVQPEWRYAASLDSVRHRIFVGHPAGMPTFGVAGITLREIDGVAYYVLYHLRPEVLGNGSAP
jgi:mono/diheme cytochrome c family protein